MTPKDYQTLRWVNRIGKVHQSKMRPKALQTLARAGFVTVEVGWVSLTEEGRIRAKYGPLLQLAA